jgi:hypothetical protein
MFCWYSVAGDRTAAERAVVDGAIEPARRPASRAGVTR